MSAFELTTLFVVFVLAGFKFKRPQTSRSYLYNCVAQSTINVIHDIMTLKAHGEA